MLTRRFSPRRFGAFAHQVLALALAAVVLFAAGAPIAQAGSGGDSQTKKQKRMEEVRKHYEKYQKLLQKRQSGQKVKQKEFDKLDRQAEKFNKKADKRDNEPRT
jgi:hypothetical protein